jgi:glutamate synthase domain-containing protein 2
MKVVTSGVAKRHANHILIMSHNGKTRISQWCDIKSKGLPWKLGLAEKHQTLVSNGLQSHTTMQTNGLLKNGHDIIIAALPEAKEFRSSTALLITLDYIMMCKYHKTTCLVDITT